MHLVQLVLCAALIALAPSVALADDWVASKVRGPVLHYVNGEWAQLRRGDVIPDDRPIRTLKGGKMVLQRGKETIELSSQTQIRIVDKPGREFTTVRQEFGKVTVEVDVRQFQHFAVETPMLVVVVKGTRFTVVSGQESAEVSVRRGKVAVTDVDTRQTTLLAPGQSASTRDGGEPLLVDGPGKPPVVFSANGKPVAVPAEAKGSDNGEERAAGKDMASSGDNGGGNGNGGGSGNAGGNGGGGDDDDDGDD
jgi:hypothetical protein